MMEEFDDVFEDDITTLTFTYADDEVYDYIKSFGLTSRPIKLSIEFCVYEDSEEENF